MSYILEPVVSFFQRSRLSRTQSIILVYIILLACFVLLGHYFIPRFLEDLRELASSIPEYVKTIQGFADSTREMSSRYNLPPAIERGAVKALTNLEKALDQTGENLFGMVLSSFTVISFVILAPVISFYFLRDINKWRQKILVFLAKYSVSCMDLIRDIDSVFSGFVRGQAIVALFVMIMVWIVTLVLGIKYTAVLGIIAGLGEFIPFFGPVIAAVPLVLFGFVKSFTTGMLATGAVLFIQWLDGNIIVPRVTGTKVGLHPLWMLFAVLAGGKLLGFWGVFIAVPVAGMVKALIKYFRTLV